MSIDNLFIRWSGARAILHNGWWLVTSLYLVTNGHLSPSQLVFIGVVQGIAAFLFEVPAGVVADTFSRKWSVVISHMLMGVAMLMTGLVTDFGLLLATQVLWGVSWTFASGADVAWITDELNQPKRIAGVLTRSARAQLSGAAIGIISIGTLAWATSLGTAIILSGCAMLLLGVYVAVTFREERFTPVREQRWLATWKIFKDGLFLVRNSRTILLVFAATFLVNGAADAYVRLFPKQLVDIGIPPGLEPVAWLTSLSIAALLVGAFALRVVEARVHGADVARIDYAFACLAGVVGLIIFSFAPNALIGVAGVLLVSGIALPLTRTLAAIMVNSRTIDKVRATVHSFLAQAEYLGEILCGAAIGILANLAELSVTLTACAGLLAVTAILMWRWRTDPVPAVIRE
ncbi:MAG TPA: MFS transporter [Candidatus Saccharimonadales bacterium]|nr:MFS transporter [Candidatus Saccharimonadales bacterium]